MVVGPGLALVVFVSVLPFDVDIVVCFVFEEIVVVFVVVVVQFPPLTPPWAGSKTTGFKICQTEAPPLTTAAFMVTLDVVPERTADALKVTGRDLLVEDD